MSGLTAVGQLVLYKYSTLIKRGDNNACLFQLDSLPPPSRERRYTVGVVGEATSRTVFGIGTRSSRLIKNLNLVSPPP